MSPLRGQVKDAATSRAKTKQEIALEAIQQRD